MADASKAPVCSRCRQLVTDQRVLQAMGRDWHQACFRCTDCGSALDKYYYERDANPFCDGCFLRRFGKRCHGCSQYITGPIMAAQDRLYHTECFLCGACGKMLDVGELFAIRDAGIVCAACTAQGSPVTATPRLPAATDAPPANTKVSLG
eukprot:Opistho-2@43980